MRVAVLGAGGVGTFLAKEMAAASHDVVLVDRSSDALLAADEQADVLTLRGDITHRRCLARADVDRADLVVAVTGNDDTNVVAAGLASALGARRTAARVDDPDFFSSHSGVERGVLGAGLLMCASRLVCDELVRLVERRYACHVGHFASNTLQVAALPLKDDNRALGHRTADVPLPNGVRCTGVVRDGTLRQPTQIDRLEDDDALVLAGSPASVLKAITDLCGERRMRRALVVGGGDVGIQVAERLSFALKQVLLIDQDPKRCEELARALPAVTVVVGDGTSLGVLQDEHAESAEFAISATRADEVNLMSALMLKDLGVRNVFALVHRPGYADVYAHLGVQGTAGAHDAILRIVQRTMPGTGIVGRELLTGSGHELLEVLLPRELREGTTLASLSLPPETLVMGVVRRGQSVAWTAQAPLEPRDLLVLAALPHTARHVERAVQRLKKRS